MEVLHDDYVRPLNERVALAGGASIGVFRCRPTDTMFREDRSASRTMIVFPRTPVRIAHSGSPARVMDALTVVFYNRGQEYTRSAVSPLGDQGDWIAFDDGLAVEAAGARGERPFSREAATASPRMVLRARRLVRRARDGGADELELEEEAVALLALALKGAGSDAAGPLAATGARRRVADRAREALATDLGAPLALADVAERVGVSVFHLCRVFRSCAGVGMHAYRTRLRLLAAMDRLLAGEEDLTRLALELGFSSHSHFTDSFRRCFGAAPSRVRRERSASKNAEALRGKRL
jgi:AraC-like DNA-binding protein